MLKSILSFTALILMVGCGGENSSSEPSEEVVEVSSPLPLSNLQKLNKATSALNFTLTRFRDRLNITSEKETLTFKNYSYILKNIEEEHAFITLGSSDFERFEKRKSVVINTNLKRLPRLERGYRNIVINSDTEIETIQSELANIFTSKGTSVLSYNLNDMEKNSTIMIMGDNDLFSCINETTDDILEVVSENSLLSLPIEIAGHYLCFDEDKNKVFDYNLTFTSSDIAGLKYTFDPNLSDGASIDIYNIVDTQVNVKSLEETLRSAGSIQVNEILILKVFYKKVTDRKRQRKEVFRNRAIMLPVGEYDIYYTLTASQNKDIDIDNKIQNPFSVIEEVPTPKLTPHRYK